jgi:hypothetical protein
MFTLRSPAFEPDSPIPPRHSCDGEDLSPPLEWTDLPAGTRSLALLVDDPDAPDPAAPKRVWVHWIRYNIPPEPNHLSEGAGNRPPPPGQRETLTDADTLGYQGPCPPIGRHRYYFRLMALDSQLPDLGPRARRREFEAAIHGHLLGIAVLMGTRIRPASRR